MEKGKWKDKENSTNSLKKLNAKRHYGKIEETFLICGRENQRKELKDEVDDDAEEEEFQGERTQS